DSHTMVFANRSGYPSARPGNQPLRYTYTAEDESGRHQSDVISQYAYQQSMGISGVNGVFTLQNEAWDVTQPSEPIARFSSFRAGSQSDTGDLPFNQYKIVQYGFSDSEVRNFAQSTDQAMRTANIQLTGASFCPFLRIGHRFRMVSTVHDVRPELDGVEFVLTQVQHNSSLDGEYQNQFSATLATGLITTVSVQDTQQGVVMARVTTQNGNDAVKDWPYYVPDDFELAKQLQEDSQGVQKRLNAKGVYVRFSTDEDTASPVWVKLASHMQTIPEVGVTVWVSRANDESELPEIQNIVQADGGKTITDSDWTAHTQAGNSYSTSYGDSKSIRFGQPWSRDDVDSAVKLVENAYARGIFRDAGYSRGGSYNYSTTEQKEQGMLNESWSYGSTYNNSWGQESKSFSATGRSYHESVTGKCDASQQSTESSDAEAMAAVSASRSVVYGDTYSNSTSNGNTKSIAVYNGNLENDSTHNGTVLSNTTISGTSTNNSTHYGKVSSTTTINADSDNTSTITGTSTNTSNHSIVHNYTTIGAQSSSSAIGASNGNDVIGISNTNAATGVSNRNSLTGVNVDVSLQGMGNTMSITGMENRASITGMSNALSVTGESNSVNVTGASTTVEVAGPGVHVSVKSDQANIDLNGPVMQIPVIILVL
ncbi:MAG TPA: contractile injection system protein, VgrG/Pvc8 family, partial [Rhodocyclaceae bacterium]|nr:contractile injection system protein, VgrG/Pvc8 family [Rhodocyclaceae bacterium]